MAVIIVENCLSLKADLSCPGNHPPVINYTNLKNRPDFDKPALPIGMFEFFVADYRTFLWCVDKALFVDVDAHVASNIIVIKEEDDITFPG